MKKKKRKTRKINHAQVLEIASGELLVGNDLDLAVALLRDLHRLAQISDAAVDLDPVMQELLKGRDVEDLVAGRLRGIDDELFQFEGCTF